MSYDGFYINLDRSTDRRPELESELARLGLNSRYKRHAASQGNALDFPNPRLNSGEMGCFTSHYLTVQNNLAQGHHLHIIEDDVVLASCMGTVLDRIIATDEIDGFDILYTDIAISLSNEAYREFKKLYDTIVTRDDKGAIKSASFQIIGLNRFMSPAASSYLVNGRSAKKIAPLLHGELRKGAELPIDAFFFEHIKAGTLKAGFVFPFITSVRTEHIMNSTIRKVPDTTLRFTAANIARYSFFIGCEMNECQKLLAQILTPPAMDDIHARILSDVLAFSLGSDEKEIERLNLKTTA